VSDPIHHHAPAPRVLAALVLTIAAAAVELAAARHGHSLFLAADALHLLAHVGIFAVLLLPVRGQHELREDVATVVVLLIVLLVAAGMAWEAISPILAGEVPEVRPAWMLVSLVGLAANVGSAWCLRDPARERWSFRAALAHELADGSLTIVGLIGALAIRLLGWRWIDPALSLAIVVWLAGWALRLLGRRVAKGRDAWAR
jgi:cobalt-zinc-cadmium efflux system protein